MKLSTRLPRLCDVLDAGSRYMGSVLFWLPLAMVLVTMAVVLMRYGLQISIPAMQESVVYMHSAIIALTAGFTLERDGHVRIDFLYRGWSPRRRAWVNLLGALLFLVPFCLFFVSYSLNYVFQSWRVLEVSAEAQGLPFVYLQKSLLLALPALLIIQGVSLALRSAVLLFYAEPEE